MADITLRPFTIANYDPVLKLWLRTEGLHIGESDTPAALDSFLKRNPGLSQIATSPTGEILGAVLCGHDGRRGYLHHLAVAMAHRRQGIAHALVDRCLGLLRDEGITRCNLFLLADNDAGKAFWQCEGWKIREGILLVQKGLVPLVND